MNIGGKKMENLHLMFLSYLCYLQVWEQTTTAGSWKTRGICDKGTKEENFGEDFEQASKQCLPPQLNTAPANGSY